MVAAGTVLVAPRLDMRKLHLASDNRTPRPPPNRNGRPTRLANSTIAITVTGTGVMRQPVNRPRTDSWGLPTADLDSGRTMILAEPTLVFERSPGLTDL